MKQWRLWIWTIFLIVCHGSIGLVFKDNILVLIIHGFLSSFPCLCIAASFSWLSLYLFLHSVPTFKISYSGFKNSNNIFRINGDGMGDSINCCLVPDVKCYQIQGVYNIQYFFPSTAISAVSNQQHLIFWFIVSFFIITSPRILIGPFLCMKLIFGKVELCWSLLLMCSKNIGNNNSIKNWNHWNTNHVT